MSNQVTPEPTLEQVGWPAAAVVAVGAVSWFLLAILWQVDDWVFFTCTSMSRFVAFWGGIHIELVCITLFMWLFCPTRTTRVGVLGIVLLVGNAIPQFVLIIGDLARLAGMSNLYMTGLVTEFVIGFVLLMFATFTAKPKDNF